MRSSSGRPIMPIRFLVVRVVSALAFFLLVSSAHAQACSATAPATLLVGSGSGSVIKLMPPPPYRFSLYLGFDQPHSPSTCESVQWDFGDGSAPVTTAAGGGTGAHVFTPARDYSVRATVTSTAGWTKSATTLLVHRSEERRGGEE